MSRSLAILMLTLPLMTLPVGCGGSKSLSPSTVYLPSSTETECLRIPPPKRPKLTMCKASQQPSCDSANLSALLDYLVSLDKWSAIAWSLCGVRPMPSDGAA